MSPARPRWATAVLGGVALLITGCGGSDPAASSPSSATPTTVTGTTSASPTPTAVVPDLPALQKQATAALIAPGGLVAVGGARKPSRDEKETFWVTDVCGRNIAADAGQVHASHSRTWSADGLWVNNTTHAYTVPGTTVLAQVKEAVGSCKKYKSEDESIDILGPATLPSYPGTEARYGYCYRTERASGTDFVACEAFLARGNLVSAMMVIRGSSRKSNTDGLVVVGAVAAEALGRGAA
ncbi:hypothetical protein [Micromonospora sp. WMMD987]|jgi:hypothetical protein|uniref:hypothetical protein n=1 Tax=Micromonospora TaxID=1873 RepID=UPI00249B22F9|nr:hypothetical protein [Micromonospora sp. WMMD987]WFE96069.1 hypothetical protein O7612_03865 [Micromonospora sp. WMMD987]